MIMINIKKLLHNAGNIYKKRPITEYSIYKKKTVKADPWQNSQRYTLYSNVKHRIPRLCKKNSTNTIKSLQSNSSVKYSHLIIKRFVRNTRKEQLST